MPGLALDRMCAGALTAVTVGAGEIATARPTPSLCGGVEHMGHHPMGAEVDFNPRFVAERLIDESAAVMGQTAENLHDVYPELTKADADAFAVRSQQRAAAAWENGVMRETVVPLAVFSDAGWGVADATSSCGRTRRSTAWPRCRPRSGSAAASPPATRPA